MTDFQDQVQPMAPGDVWGDQNAGNDTGGVTLDEFLPVLTGIRRPRRALTAIPSASFVPKSFPDQIQLVDDGINPKAVYVYINGVWTKLVTPPAPVLFTPTSPISTIFENLSRFNTGGSTAPALGVSGLDISHTRAGGGGGYTTVDWQINQGGNSSIFAGEPFASGKLAVYSFASASMTGHLYFGLGEITFTGTTEAYTQDHAGFKIIANGTLMELWATTGDGTTEKATDLGAITFAIGEQIDFYIKLHGAATVTSVDFYWRKGTGVWSAVTTHTVNLPRVLGTGQSIRMASNGSGAAGTVDLRWQGATFGN